MEFFGVLFGATILFAKVGLAVLNPFDGVTGQDVAAVYETFCVDTLKGKWEPKALPADSCPGGKWANVVAAPK